MLVKHLTGTPFSLHQSEEKFVRLFFISVSQFVSYLHTHTHTQTHTHTHRHTNKQNIGKEEINPICPRVFLSDHALGRAPPPFDTKFGTAILCNVTTKMVEKNFQICSYRDYGTTNYVNFLKKLCEKWLFFSKIRWQLEKKCSRSFFSF